MTKRLTDRDLLVDALDALEQAGCQYWACLGPRAPIRGMQTCNVCAQVQRIRRHLEMPRADWHPGARRFDPPPVRSWYDPDQAGMGTLLGFGGLP